MGNIPYVLDYNPVKTDNSTSVIHCGITGMKPPHAGVDTRAFSLHYSHLSEYKPHQLTNRTENTHTHTIKLINQPVSEKNQLPVAMTQYQDFNFDTISIRYFTKHRDIDTFNNKYVNHTQA